MDKLKVVNNLYSVVHTCTLSSNSSAIADTGASGNNLKADATHDLASWPVEPIQVKQPNGQILYSTRGCQLELAILPDEAR